MLSFNVSFTTWKFDEAFWKWMHLIGYKSSQITFCVMASFSCIPLSQAISLFWELLASDTEKPVLLMNLNTHLHSSKLLETLGN